MRHFSQSFFALALTALLLPAGYVQASVKEKLENVATDQLQNVDVQYSQALPTDFLEQFQGKASSLMKILNLIAPKNLNFAITLMITLKNECKGTELPREASS